MNRFSRREIVIVMRSNSSIAHAAVSAMLYDLFNETAGVGIPSDPVTLSLMLGMLGEDAQVLRETVSMLIEHRYLVSVGDRLLAFEDKPTSLGRPQSKKRNKEDSEGKEPKEKRLQLAQYVFMTASHRDKWVDELGTKNFLRCVEKLDAWIGQDATPKRIKNGYNADCTFRSWVVRSVLGESNKPEPIAQKTNVSRALKELFGDD